MRPVFPKITEIQRDRSGPISEKSALFTNKKISTVHRKSAPLIEKSVQKSDSSTSDFSHSVEFLNTGCGTL
jgi:hypothetical protein